MGTPHTTQTTAQHSNKLSFAVVVYLVNRPVEKGSVTAAAKLLVFLTARVTFTLSKSLKEERIHPGGSSNGNFCISTAVLILWDSSEDILRFCNLEIQWDSQNPNL